jgi:hypothetical protein
MKTPVGFVNIAAMRKKKYETYHGAHLLLTRTDETYQFGNPVVPDSQMHEALHFQVQ